jgi:cysteine desulfurase
MIYLDYNASIPLRPDAKEAILSVLDFVGNASSPHTFGRKLRSSVESARKEILEITHAKRLVFTSGGTEANTLALSGLGSLPLLVSAIEHDSVLKGARNPHIVPVTKEGVVDLEQLEKLLSSFNTPGLLSIMLVNNETGVIQPVQEAASIAHRKGWKIHTDASQALGHISLSFEELGVDLISLSSHKCGGPVGVGALLMKEDIHLKPLIPGGGQEFGMRSGTLSAPLILGFAAAMKEALKDEPYAVSKFQQRVEKSLTQATIYGKNSPRTSHVSCIGMHDVTAEFQVMAFDLKNIAISAGSACSSGKMKASHVLLAMGVPPEEAKCAIRVSMGWKTTEADVDAFIQAWQEIYTTQNMKESI